MAYIFAHVDSILTSIVLVVGPGLLSVWVFISAARQILRSRKHISSIPASVSWAGRRDESFSKLRACLRELFAGLQTLQAGYDKFCKHGRMFVIPDFGLRPQVMIPQKHLAWFVEQPETVVSARAPQIGRFAGDLLTPTLDWTHDGYMTEMIRKDFTRSLAKLQPDVIEDLVLGVRSCLSVHCDEWHDVSLWKTMEKIIFRSTLRMVVGPKLSQNARFTNSIAAFASCLGFGAVVVGQLTPPPLKPLIGYIFAVPIFLAQKLAFLYLIPEIQLRLNALREKRRDPNFKWDEPKDLMMWMIRTSLDRQDEKRSQPSQIAARLLFLMLGAIHTTIMTSTNMMLDLLSSPPEYGYLDTLRHEVDEIFQTQADWEDHALVGSLRHADSALRETLRKSPVLTRVVLREVIARDGIIFPDGEHLPKGTWIGIPSMGVHHDENFYPRPEIYDPFRFVRGIETAGPAQAEKASTTEVPKTVESKAISRKSTAFSTTSDTYLPFGYGRHSCPGRWFVAMQLKLFLAHLVSRYDFEPLESRPLNSVFGDSIIPPTKTRIRLRKRQA